MNELQAVSTSGQTLYAVLLNATGQAWNGSAFETLAGANWTTYALLLTEAAAGIYFGAMPTAVAGEYSYIVYEQAGASPATTDKLRGGGSLLWDGATLVSVPSAAAAAILANPANLLATDASGRVEVSGTENTLDAVLAALVADIGDEVIEGVHTRDDVLRLVLALMSKVSGGGSSPLVYRDSTDTKDRIVQTVDADGNRSVVILDGAL